MSTEVTPPAPSPSPYKSGLTKAENKQPTTSKRLSASERESNQKRIGELLNGIVK
jgi:hypothetical protein